MNSLAQHATATCCRKCIQKWHEIEKGRALKAEEVDYIVALVLGWILPPINGILHLALINCGAERAHHEFRRFTNFNL